jgi:DNA-binding response OmpR family regulator
MSDRRLLVVDDEPDFAEFVSSAATDLGYQAKACTRSADFRRLYAEFAPTHIVLDVVMPDVDGIEIMQWLADQGATAKVIVTTGYNPQYAKMAGLVGADRGLELIDTLTKPVRLAQLRAALA